MENVFIYTRHEGIASVYSKQLQQASTASSYGKQLLFPEIPRIFAPMCHQKIAATGAYPKTPHSLSPTCRAIIQIKPPIPNPIAYLLTYFV